LDAVDLSLHRQLLQTKAAGESRSKRNSGGKEHAKATNITTSAEELPRRRVRGLDVGDSDFVIVNNKRVFARSTSSRRAVDKKPFRAEWMNLVARAGATDEKSFLLQNAPVCAGHQMPSQLLTVKKAGANKVSSRITYEAFVIDCITFWFGNACCVVWMAINRDASFMAVHFQRISVVSSFCGLR
jgi:hypothetical protein